jgi:hypothetical protein
MRDNRTYGFSKADADDLIAGIGSGESTFPEQKPRSSGSGTGDGGGGGGDEIFAFELTGDMADKEAPADISELDGAAIGAAVESSTVYDPLDIFFLLVSGSKGLCIRRAGVYYIIQAKCPVSEA